MGHFARYRGHSLLLGPLREKPPFVLDLGANRGDFSRTLEAEFGGEFHLVEANPQLVAEIRANTCFKVLHRAVGTKRGMVRLNIAANDEASSILKLPEASAYNAVPEGIAEVEEVPLEELVCEQGRPVDVLKLDIEGAEITALSALSDATLQSVAQISVEFHCDPSFGFGESEKVRHLLERYERNNFFVLDFSAPHKMDVLLLNRSVLSPSRAQLWLWRFMPAVIWVRQRHAKFEMWRRTAIGFRPREEMRRWFGSD